jgi:hypothetical protein
MEDAKKKHRPNFREPIKVRFSDDEKKELYKRAEAANMNISDYVRNRTVGGKPLVKKANPQQEALILALGDLGQLLKRVEALAAAIDNVSPDVMRWIKDDIQEMAEKVRKT